MNRRELLKRGFELGAAGLLLPMVEPIRRYWSLDRTMVPAESNYLMTPWFDASMSPFTKYFYVPTDLEPGRPISSMGPTFATEAAMWDWYRTNRPDMPLATYLKIPIG